MALPWNSVQSLLLSRGRRGDVVVSGSALVEVMSVAAAASAAIAEIRGIVQVFNRGLLSMPQIVWAIPRLTLVVIEVNGNCDLSCTYKCATIYAECHRIVIDILACRTPISIADQAASWW